MKTTRGQLFLKLGRTLNLNLGCFGMGLVMSLTGVALLDLAEIYSTDVTVVSHLITSRCVGSLVGSLLGGKLFDTYNTQLMCIATQLISTVTILLIPLGGNIAVAHAVSVIGGLGIGAFDTGANVWIIKLWPENANPALQTFHLCFGGGSFLAPFIAEPFMSTSTNRSGEEAPSFNEPFFDNNSTNHLVSNETTGAVNGESRVQYPFGMVSAFHLLVAVSMIVLYRVDGASFKPHKTKTDDTDESGFQKKTAEEVRFSRLLLSFLAVFICVYVALECTSSQMLTAYSVIGDLHFSKSSGSRLAAVYFLSFTVSRATAALVTVKVSPFQMLVACNVMLISSASVLLVWGSSSDMVLWTCSALLGLGQGPIYAAAVAWTVQYIDISNKMMSVVLVMAGVGSLSPPLLVGQFLDSYPNAFLYVCFLFALLCASMFIVMAFYVRRRPTVRPEGAEYVSVNT